MDITPQARGYSHARPFDEGFYSNVTAKLASAPLVEHYVVAEPGANVIDVRAGQTIAIELLEGPQIVNVFLVNPWDPDERYWGHQTWIIDGLFLTRGSRLWGTMARLRPLLTIVEDTVTLKRAPGAITGKHHIAVGGGGTPALWRDQGGDPSAVTTWEQLTAGLSARGWSAGLLKDNACLFQKTRVDQYSHQFSIERSDAVRGDRVTFFAERDLTVLLALSPYLGGGVAPSDLVATRPLPVAVSVNAVVAEPLPWPYPGVPYPDLDLYVDATGSRSTEPVPTPGREA